MLVEMTSITTLHDKAPEVLFGMMSENNFLEGSVKILIDICTEASPGMLVLDMKDATCTVDDHPS